MKFIFYKMIRIHKWRSRFPNWTTVRSVAKMKAYYKPLKLGSTELTIGESQVLRLNCQQSADSWWVSADDTRRRQTCQKPYVPYRAASNTRSRISFRVAPIYTTHQTRVSIFIAPSSFAKDLSQQLIMTKPRSILWQINYFVCSADVRLVDLLRTSSFLVRMLHCECNKYSKASWSKFVK